MREEAEAPIAMHVYADAIRACCAKIDTSEEDEDHQDEEGEGDIGAAVTASEVESVADEVAMAPDDPVASGGDAERIVERGVPASPDASTADTTPFLRAMAIFNEVT